MAQTATFRAGSGDPLVLLHIGANPWKKWENCLPALTAEYDVFVPTYPGFEGGPPLSGPATIDTFADAVEAEMDAAGIGTAHVVGNSLGGWIAMELARRGRARSAIALSPGGGWATRWGQLKVRLFFGFNGVLNRISGPIRPFIFRSALVRRLALSGVVHNGERVSVEQALAIAGDSMKGAKGDFWRALNVSREVVKPYPDPGIPTLVAWCEKDRLTPLHPDGDVWRAATPHAEWRVLPGLGHLPMFDDPEQTTELVLDWLAKADGRAATD
jgi:pimeloyl-ACP methyl ester carboxylesterase